jgi:hypothetical protein
MVDALETHLFVVVVFHRLSTVQKFKVENQKGNNGPVRLEPE